MGIAIELGMRDVLFASWPIEPDVLAPHLPASLSVDARDGRAWITAIALENAAVRPRGLPRAVGLDVTEVNLNAKVTRDGVPGIYYLSVDVASALGTVYTRLFQHAPYHYAATALTRTGDRVRFACRRRHPGSRPLSFSAEYGPSGDTLEERPAGDGGADSRDSLARFLTERHRFFAEMPDETLVTATVSYPRWPLAPADATIGRNTLFRANGLGEPAAEPVCYYSPGVEAVMSPTVPWASGDAA